VLKVDVVPEVVVVLDVLILGATRRLVFKVDVVVVVLEVDAFAAGFVLLLRVLLLATRRL
jgi:hypothetical protein